MPLTEQSSRKLQRHHPGGDVRGRRGRLCCSVGSEGGKRIASRQNGGGNNVQQKFLELGRGVPGDNSFVRCAWDAAGATHRVRVERGRGAPLETAVDRQRRRQQQPPWRWQQIPWGDDAFVASRELDREGFSVWWGYTAETDRNRVGLLSNVLLPGPFADRRRGRSTTMESDLERSGNKDSCLTTMKQKAPSLQFRQPSAGAALEPQRSQHRETRRLRRARWQNGMAKRRETAADGSDGDGPRFTHAHGAQDWRKTDGRLVLPPFMTKRPPPAHSKQTSHR